MEHILDTPDRSCPAHPDAGITFVETPTLRHFGRWNCADCGRYLVWSRDPRTERVMKARQREILKYMQKVLEEPDIPFSDEDMKFLFDIYSKTHLNLIQQQKYINLIDMQ